MTAATQAVRIAVLTISDGVTAGTRDDMGGAEIVQWTSDRGHELIAHLTVPDAHVAITAALIHLADRDAPTADVVLTTGGTGLTRRDVTPEATRAVIHREAPGIAERIRAVGADCTPYAALSRGVAGTRGNTLIINLPGSPGGVRDGLRVLDALIDHAVQLLRGVDTSRHDPANG